MKIEVKDVVKVYKEEDESSRVLDNIDFSITSGEFVCITGRSGSGKSTLLNIIAGLTRPTSGCVLLDGQDILTLSDVALSLYRNEKVGCLPQVSSLLSSLTVLDNVRLPFYLAKREGDSTEEAYRLLQAVGLAKLAKRMPKRLSGGQLKRVAIARSMINKPDLLLVDEPTSDLDVQTTQEVLQLFRKIADEGTAILMVTHDLETMKYVDQCYEMRDGVLRLQSM